ncbi:MAG: SDR family oxidoreductase [Zavarzinella sp.]
MAVLIIGCGYLGFQVAKQLIAQGQEVHAVTRTRGAELAAAGIQPNVGDITGKISLNAYDAVIYAVARDRASGISMRELYYDGLNNVLDQLPPPARFLYVGSTSVYGQTDGSWVNEDSETEPLEENGRLMLECERLLISRLPHANVVRFAGIYGPGRILRRAELLAGHPLVGNADKWLNLIHRDDGAAALLAILQQAPAGRHYLVADNHPVSRRDFYIAAAEVLGAPPAKFEDGPETARHGGHRRISSARLQSETTWVPKFPSFRQGLPDSVSSV